VRIRHELTPNDFEGTDVERINAALEVAAGTGRSVVIPRENRTADGATDRWLLDSAVLVPGDTTLVLDNCHLKLSDRCRDSFIRSANCGVGIAEIAPIANLHIRGVGNAVLEGADHPRATGDGAKTLGERTYGTDAGAEVVSQTGDWRNIGVLFAYVEGFSIEGLRMKDSHAWGISLERCAHGTVRDISFESTGRKQIDGVEETILNQDGLDLRMGCHDILIESITGYTGDDLIALTAIPGTARPGGTASTMISGTAYRGEEDDIRHVTIRDVRGYCAGGHHIVRLLNTSGAKMHDIILDGLTDTSPPDMRCRAAVKIGDKNYGEGVAPLGDTYRIIVNNVISRSEHTIMIGGSLCDSIISNVIRYDVAGQAISLVSGPEYMRDVMTSNLHVVEE